MNESRTRSGRRRAQVLLLALCAALAACAGEGGVDLDPSLIHTVERGDLTITVRERGEIQAAEDTRVSSQLEGRATLIYLIDEGTVVQAGQKVAEMDVSQIEEKRALQEATARMFNVVLGSIAFISLLVGGIGIMNVMLATVTERTREIGIRRALGAKKKHIVRQFLVETVVLSCSGGLLGVGLGLAIPSLITAFSASLTIIRPEHVAIAFGISACVGISFGLYPAWRAANMDPVEALRHE